MAKKQNKLLNCLAGLCGAVIGTVIRGMLVGWGIAIALKYLL